VPVLFLATPIFIPDHLRDLPRICPLLDRTNGDPDASYLFLHEDPKNLDVETETCKPTPHEMFHVGSRVGRVFCSIRKLILEALQTNTTRARPAMFG
jgi:hypothetical protein